MPALLIVFADPVKVAMLLICIFGAAFMIWFLVGLFADRTRMHARYVVRFKFGEAQPATACADPLRDESLVEEAWSGKRQTDRGGRFPVQVRIQQRF